MRARCSSVGTIITTKRREEEDHAKGIEGGGVRFIAIRDGKFRIMYTNKKAIKATLAIAYEGHHMLY